MDSSPHDIRLAFIVGPPPLDLACLQRLARQDARTPILGASSRTLLASLKAARSLGCTHAISLTAGAMDDYTSLLDSAKQNPTAISLGYRTPATPMGLCARISDLFVRLETGLRLRDPRGPRVYPLRLIDFIPASRHPNLTHMEMLIRAAWVGCPIIEVPLGAMDHARDASTPSLPYSGERAGVRGHSREQRNSQNHPSPQPSPPSTGERGQEVARTAPALRSLPAGPRWRESLTHLRLLARALSSWPHPKYDAAVIRPTRPPVWRSVLQWFNPLRAWRELRQGGATRSEVAAGLAAGVFIANTPAWGFHTVLSLYVAKRLHLHPLAVVAGSHVSAPPMGPFLVASAMWLGHVLLHGSRPVWSEVTPFHGKFVAHALPLLLDWMVGAAVVGTSLSITVFIVANFLFRFLERRERAVNA